MADQGSEGLLSPFLRSQRIKAVRPHLVGGVLDFGCGSGSLAAYIHPDQYFGFDRDEKSLMLARQQFVNHRFESEIDKLKGKVFDTVATLAVIEHVEDPVDFLILLKGFLAHNSDAKIICTTPHPSMDSVHMLGAKVGLFSRHANEEHQALLNYHTLEEMGNRAGLKIAFYSRFLLGANQIIAFERKEEKEFGFAPGNRQDGNEDN